MSAEIKVTPRQLECLVNIYLGDAWDGHRSTERYSWREGDDVAVIPAWGRPDSMRRGSSMGGAKRRMHDAMGDADLLVVEYSERGYRYVRDRLTTKGLKALKAKYPELPEIDQRIADREQIEADEAAAAEAKRAENRRQLDASRERRKAARAEQMAAVLRDYQISHSLTEDQLRDMWMRIVDEEHSL